MRQTIGIVVASLLACAGCVSLQPSHLTPDDRESPGYEKRVEAFLAKVKQGQTRTEVDQLLKRYGPFESCPVPKGDVGPEIHFRGSIGHGCVVIVFDARGIVRGVNYLPHSM
jgi:hypothetical protein